MKQRLIIMLLAMVCVAVMVTGAFAGPKTRTVEIEAYQDMTFQYEVPFVLNDPNDPVDESMCPVELKYRWVEKCIGRCCFPMKEYYLEAVCPPGSVQTHTVSGTFNYSEIVTDVFKGDTVRVRGAIWTAIPRVVEYWYRVEKVYPTDVVKLIERSEKVSVPDVEDVLQTEPYEFVAEHSGIYRVWLKVKKMDGRVGGIFTKIVVHDAD